MKTASIQVTGMHCDRCVARLSEALNTLPGLGAIEISIGVAKIEFDDVQCTMSSIAQAVRSIEGFDLAAFSTSSLGC